MQAADPFLLGVDCGAHRLASAEVGSLLLWGTQCLPPLGQLQLSHIELCYRLHVQVYRTFSWRTSCRAGHLSDGAVSLSSAELWTGFRELMEIPDTIFPLLNPEGLPLQGQQLIRLVRAEGCKAATNCLPCTLHVSTCPYGHLTG